MSNITRRSALAGTATAALIAAMPIAAAVVPVVSAVNDADVKLIAAWREWNDLENKLHALFIADKWASHHGDTSHREKRATEISALGKPVDKLVREIATARATTPAGFLCKLDLAMDYGPNVEDNDLEDYPWLMLVNLMDSLKPLAPDVTPGWLARRDAHRAVHAEIAAREEQADIDDLAEAKRAYPNVVFLGRD